MGELFPPDPNAGGQKDFLLPAVAGDIAGRAAFRKKGVRSCLPKSVATRGASFRVMRATAGADFPNPVGIAEHSARPATPRLMFPAATLGLTGANTSLALPKLRPSKIATQRGLAFCILADYGHVGPCDRPTSPQPDVQSCWHQCQSRAACLSQGHE